jgi:ketosteroid isomerase-like protein
MTMTVMTTTTMTTTDPMSTRVRLSMRRAALLAITVLALFAVAGCSPGEPDTSADVVESTTSTVSSAGVAPGGEQGAEQSAVPLDGGVLLSSALALYGDGYQFAAVAEVQGSEAAVISGVVIGQSARMTITSGDATVSYVITPDGSWIQTEGGEWQEVDSVGAIERPLQDLASPTSITIVSSDGDGIAALAVYDGAAFDSEDVIEMNLRFADGRLVSASYTTQGASVSTTFSPVDGATIEIPTNSA